MLAGEDVQIGAAEPDRGDLDDHVVRLRRGIVDRRDLDLARPCHHHGSHADSVSLSSRVRATSGRVSSWPATTAATRS